MGTPAEEIQSRTQLNSDISRETCITYSYVFCLPSGSTIKVMIPKHNLPNRSGIILSLGNLQMQRLYSNGSLSPPCTGAQIWRGQTVTLIIEGKTMRVTWVHQPNHEQHREQYEKFVVLYDGEYLQCSILRIGEVTKAFASKFFTALDLDRVNQPVKHGRQSRTRWLAISIGIVAAICYIYYAR